ncbi:DUF2304 domain-containing protein [Candidatus Saccharibacteria bacterium]|nr:DUF2304 domain-containing protein [Candidatus Saccharibacteria bacterium]
MTNLQIEMSIATILLLIIIASSLKRNTISIKSSIAWLLLPIVFLIIAIFPSPLESLANWLGFETLSNFIFVIIIALLLILNFSLTITTSKQQNQITKLIQEVSILKYQKEEASKPTKK